MKSQKLLNYIKERPLFKDSAWAILGSVVGKGLSLIAGIIIARFLGKETYGEYGIIRTTLTYLAIVSTFGFGYTATKYVADYLKNNIPKVRPFIKVSIKITLIFSLFIAVIQVIFAKQFANFLRAPQLERIFQYFSILVVTNAITTTQIGVLSGFKLFKENAKVNVVTGIVTFIASVLFTRRFKQQLQFYVKALKNSLVGVEKSSFSLGLLLILC